jgi:hypothetical protein
MALHLVSRTTKDVDVLATLEQGKLQCARPLPEWLNLKTAVERSKLAKTPDFSRVFNGSAAHFSSDNPMCHKRWQSKSTRQFGGLQPPF